MSCIGEFEIIGPDNKSICKCTYKNAEFKIKLESEKQNFWIVDSKLLIKDFDSIELENCSVVTNSNSDSIETILTCKPILFSFEIVKLKRVVFSSVSFAQEIVENE